MRFAALLITATAVLAAALGYWGFRQFGAESGPSQVGPWPLSPEGRLMVTIISDGPGGGTSRVCEADASVEIEADGTVKLVRERGARPIGVGEKVLLEFPYSGGPLWVSRDEDGVLRDTWYRCAPAVETGGTIPPGSHPASPTYQARGETPSLPPPPLGSPIP